MIKQLLISALAITAVPSWADNNVYDPAMAEPSAVVSDVTVPTIQQIEDMDLNISLDTKTVNDDPFTFDEPVTYYKNFLGEKCIDFGDDKNYYNWKRDVTYAGIPIFMSSFIIKTLKKAFRSARHTFQNKFKSEIDNYTQFAPYAAIVGLKAAGYNGRSDWPRFITSTLLSNIVMATFVNATKYSVKEMRPDNSTRNSFPSGHTATAFTAATILHKEYGLTRSPWYSVGGYAVATATGVMRVLNNRHWISDVVAGAGIGIMSTELGYFIGDLFWKNKGIMNKEMKMYRNPDRPSFFDIQMGVGIHTKRIDFQYDDPSVPNDYVELGTSTAFGVEGAYFINNYIGFGAMARVTTTPAKGLNLTSADKAQVGNLNSTLAKYSYVDASGKSITLPGMYAMYIANDNYVDTSLDAGVYGNYPINDYLDLGIKALIGGRFTGGISYKAKNGTPRLAGTFSLVNGTQGNLYYYEDVDGSQFVSCPELDNTINEYYNYVLDNPTEEYELMHVSGNNSINYVLGLSLTWHYKENFAWKVFFDFDSSKNKYTYTGRYLSDEALAAIGSSKFIDDYPKMWNAINHTYTGRAVKYFNLFTIGGSFTVNF